MKETTQPEQQRPPRRQMPVTVWGVLEVCSIVLCLATVTGFLGRLWWIFELTSHFPLQLALCLAVLALIWSAFREWHLAAVCGVFAVVNATLVALVLLPRGNSTVATGQRLRIAAINVHTENNRSDLVLNFLRNTDADVVLLMEVNDRWMEGLQPLRTNYTYSVVEPREDNFGIALFSRLRLSDDSIIKLSTAGVPSITTDVAVGNQHIRLLGTHPLPPGSSTYSNLRNQQLQHIAQYVQRQSSPVIVVGDLNVTPWSPYFRDLVRRSGLKNTSRGRGLFGSWPAWLPYARIPLDHCLVSPSISVVDKRLGPKVGSDHLPVVVDLQLPTGNEATPRK